MINFKVSGIVAASAFLLSFLIGLMSRSAMPELLLRPLIFAFVFFVLSGAIFYLVNHFLPELLSVNGGASNVDFSAGLNVADGNSHLGSQVNITEGDSPFVPSYARGDGLQDGSDAAADTAIGAIRFMGAQPDDSEENLGNIADLFQPQDGSGSGNPEAQDAGMAGTGIDQNAQDQYNSGEGDLETLPAADQFVPWEPPSFSSGADAGGAVSVPAESVPSAAIPGASSGASLSEDFFPDLDAMAGAFVQTTTDGGSASAGHSSFTAPPKRSRNNKAQGWSEDFNAKEMAMGLRSALNKDKEG